MITLFTRLSYLPNENAYFKIFEMLAKLTRRIIERPKKEKKSFKIEIFTKSGYLQYFDIRKIYPHSIDEHRNTVS